MKKNLFIILSTVILFCENCLANENPDESKIKWNTLNKKSFSIQYPSEWELNDSGILGTSFILLSPLNTETDLFRENINLITEDLKGTEIDLDVYKDISVEQCKQFVTNFYLIQIEKLENNFGDCYHLIYSGEQGIYKLIFEQYYWIIKDKAYVLTFTAEQNKYKEYLELAYKIINTFEIKK
jgi:hypothetical protein